MELDGEIKFQGGITQEMILEGVAELLSYGSAEENTHVAM